MIYYSQACWGFASLCRLKGSVFPQASLIALPSALLCLVFTAVIKGGVPWALMLKDEIDGLTKIWAGYTTVLGILLVFRNSQSFDHFTRGETGLAKLRGEWYDSTGSFFAFCSKDPEKRAEVSYFRYALVRLVSALHCFALQQLAQEDVESLEIIKIDSLDASSQKLLSDHHDRCELVVQWIKHTVMQAHATKVLKAHPKLIAGFLSGYTRGMVTLSEARNISEIQFPFPYLQTMLAMLIIHWVITPLIAAAVMDSWWTGPVMTFLCVATYWCIHYIASELDQPFGDDPNDLPIKEMQRDFNHNLMMLLDDHAQMAPTFQVDRGSTRARLTSCSTKSFGDKGHRNRYEEEVPEPSSGTA